MNADRQARPGGSGVASMGPAPAVVAAWAVGLAIGAGGIGGAGWLIGCMVASSAALAGALAAHRTGRRRAAVALVGAAVVSGGAAWWSVHRGAGAAPPLAAWVSDESTLIEVTGRVTTPPRLSAEPTGGLGQYLFDPPTTWFVLAVNRVGTAGGDWPTAGRLLVQVRGADTRMRVGDVVRCRGWLRAIEGPSNPGERDFAAAMRQRGVVGRLTLKSRGNLQWVERADGQGVDGWREAIGARASAALNAGLAPGRAETVAVLDALVLGQRRAGLEEAYTAFQRSGLAHVLSISGLHVGLLAVGVWLAVQVLTGRPGWAAMASLVAVGLYVGIVPWRVPIVRAGLMTAGVCLAFGGRWRMRATTLLSLIALGWLVVRPADLFNAGFQLSFGIVAALIVLASPVADRWMGRADAAAAQHWSWRRRAADRLGRYAIASLVAWAVATPLVAFHFGLVSIVALPLTLLALPVVAGLLWVGLIKIALGMIAPGLGAWLAAPVGWLADLLRAMASGGAALPGGWASVPSVSPGWALATLAVVIALFTGRFAGRPAAMTAAVAICLVWPFGARWVDGPDNAALTIRAIAVGEGSCFLLESRGERWLFDAGSRSSTDIGRYTIVPALQALGVDALDTIVVSHADFDHYAGVLAVAEAMPVRRVVTTDRVLDEAAGQLRFHWARGLVPRGATAHLVDGLNQRGVPIVTIAAGWGDQLGAADVRTIWPPPGRVFEGSNDNSLVMRFSVAGRRVMMCGDIQAQAMDRMIAEGMDVAADVCDLPHHGSYPIVPGRPVSPAVGWVARVGAGLWLQSCGRARLSEDPWAVHLTGTPRLITARGGMATVSIARDGSIAWQTFADP